MEIEWKFHVDGQIYSLLKDIEATFVVDTSY